MSDRACVVFIDGKRTGETPVRRALPAAMFLNSNCLPPCLPATRVSPHRRKTGTLPTDGLGPPPPPYGPACSLRKTASRSGRFAPSPP
jgi:hypothetical protein